jgi:hypothetical protein
MSVSVSLIIPTLNAEREIGALVESHVNDHQADFVRIVAERIGGIVPVYDVSELPQAIENARKMASGKAFQSHNAVFCSELTKMKR